MGALLPVPYKSQYDADANENVNDCGPACLAMVLNAFGHHTSTNMVYRKTGVKRDKYISITQLMRVGSSYEVPFSYFSGSNMGQLRQQVRRGSPVIALVHYGAWSLLNPGVSTQNPFTGAHFVVVVGFDEEHIVVHDPLWQGVRRGEGEQKAWTNKQFKEAWGTCYKDGNLNFSGIVSIRTLIPAAYPPEEKPATPPAPLLSSEMERRIRAWAAYRCIPQPALSVRAVVNSYIAAMGSWGKQVYPHEVEEGDTLPLVALRYYQDPGKYPVIEYFNGLTPVDAIHDGDVLLIPEASAVGLPLPDGERPAGRVPLELSRPNQEVSVY